MTICVNNTLTFQSIPPGVTEGGVQRYFHDFFNYAGLHRSVLLTATPRERIEDITVVTDIDGADGLVRASVEAAGEVRCGRCSATPRGPRWRAGTAGSWSCGCRRRICGRRATATCTS